MGPLLVECLLRKMLVLQTLVRLLSWSVLPNSFGSNHLPICISIVDSSTPSPSLPPLLKFRTKQANWDKFSDAVQEKLLCLPPVSLYNISFLYNEFTLALISAANI